MEVDKAFLALAEEILDEMIEAESTEAGDYDLFVKHFDDVENFGPTRFKKELMCIREDLGDYKSREYLGALKGHVDPDYPDKYPDFVRRQVRGSRNNVPLRMPIKHDHQAQAQHMHMLMHRRIGTCVG